MHKLDPFPFLHPQPKKNRFHTLIFKQITERQAMLKLNDFQFDAFRQARLTAFATHLAQRAHRLHPKAVAELDDVALVTTMEEVIRVARDHGLKKQSLMERFSDLSMVLGVGFEVTENWAREIFTNQTMPPERQLREVEASAVFIIRKG